MSCVFFCLIFLYWIDWFISFLVFDILRFGVGYPYVNVLCAGNLLGGTWFVSIELSDKGKWSWLLSFITRWFWSVLKNDSSNILASYSEFKLWDFSVLKWAGLNLFFYLPLFEGDWSKSFIWFLLSLLNSLSLPLVLSRSDNL